MFVRITNENMADPPGRALNTYIYGPHRYLCLSRRQMFILTTRSFSDCPDFRKLKRSKHSSRVPIKEIAWGSRALEPKEPWNPSSLALPACVFRKTCVWYRKQMAVKRHEPKTDKVANKIYMDSPYIHASILYMRTCQVQGRS